MKNETGLLTMRKPFETKEGVWGGFPLFTGSRVPVYIFLDCLENDISVDVFLNDYELDEMLVDGLLRYPLPPSLRHAESPV